MTTNIGHVEAANVNDPTSRESIRAGWWMGDGLLSNILTAADWLEEAAKDYGYNDMPNTGDELEDARAALFDAVKAVEEALQSDALKPPTTPAGVVTP